MGEALSGPIYDEGGQVCNPRSRKYNGGAKGDDSTNDTAAFEECADDALTTGQPMYVPNGIYQVEETWSAAIEGSFVLDGAGRDKALIKSRSGGHCMEIDGKASLSHLFMRRLGFVPSGAGHAFSVTNITAPPSDVHLEEIRIAPAVGHTGKGIYIPEHYSASFRRISPNMRSTSDHAIEVMGWIGTQFVDCYVRGVGSGKAGFRVYRGNPLFINCNGIDESGAPANADFAVLGRAISDGDASDDYCFATWIGGNCEDFTRYGIRHKEYSFSKFIDFQIMAPATGTVTPLKYDRIDDAHARTGSWDILSSIETKGAAFANGQPVHSRGCPFIVEGEYLTQYYNPFDATTYSLPSINRKASIAGVFGMKLSRGSYLNEPLVKAHVQAHTANASLSADLTGATFTNQGAAGAVTLTLPAATAGLRYRFVVDAAFAFNIQRAGADTFRDADTLKTNSTAGSILEVECVKAGTWDFVATKGTWT